MGQPKEVNVGILALQGAFVEHQSMLQKLPSEERIVVVQVRTPEDLSRCDALIIPGGESTTIALLARLAGLLDPLQEFVKARPVWGTCAGAILVAQHVQGAKKGGQDLLGGTSVTIGRNHWGPQTESFEAALTVEDLRASNQPFRGVFIRAPVILSADAPDIQVLAHLPEHHLPHFEERASKGEEEEADSQAAHTIVALRQGNKLLTTFHPELTQDDRFHDYFIRRCVLPSLSRHK